MHGDMLVQELPLTHEIVVQEENPASLRMANSQVAGARKATPGLFDNRERASSLLCIRDTNAVGVPPVDHHDHLVVSGIKALVENCGKSPSKDPRPVASGNHNRQLREPSTLGGFTVLTVVAYPSSTPFTSRSRSNIGGSGGLVTC
jgi:hypothetical protein